MKIAIVGVGFGGIMTAIHLIQKSSAPLHLYLFNDKETFGKGVAYSTTSSLHVLNVSAGKMSAFDSQASGFLDYLSAHPAYQNVPKAILSTAFIPRKIFGAYILHLWDETLKHKASNITVDCIYERVEHIEQSGNQYGIVSASKTFYAHKVVLATGNESPSDIPIPNASVYVHPTYVKYPWNNKAIGAIPKDKTVLILGNSLTSVDIILSLLEQGHQGSIHTLSPHGFNVLPHRIPHIIHPIEEVDLARTNDLEIIFRYIKKNVREYQQMGYSAEPIIDAFRPYTQRIWQGLSLGDKRIFLKRFKQLWNKARHRLAGHVHDKVQSLRIQGKLVVHRGRLIDIEISNECLNITYFNLDSTRRERLNAHYLINCTGPTSDISKSSNTLFKNISASGLIAPDDLKIGVATNNNWETLNSQGESNPHLYAIGGLLKGLLWESTAVPELRAQAEILAARMLSNTISESK